jgi:hypothetical protein
MSLTCANVLLSVRLCALATLFAAAAAQAQSTLPLRQPGFTLSGELAVDEVHRRVYAVTPEHALEAYELDTGKLVWSHRTATPAWLNAPALLTPEAVIALELTSENLEVVSLGLDGGAELWRSKPVPMPELTKHVLSSGGELPVWLEAPADKPTLCWSATLVPRSGIELTTAEQARVHTFHAEGAQRVALATGELSDAPTCRPLTTKVPDGALAGVTLVTQPMVADGKVLVGVERRGPKTASPGCAGPSPGKEG